MTNKTNDRETYFVPFSYTARNSDAFLKRNVFGNAFAVATGTPLKALVNSARLRRASGLYPVWPSAQAARRAFSSAGGTHALSRDGDYSVGTFSVASFVLLGKL